MPTASSRLVLRRRVSPARRKRDRLAELADRFVDDRGNELIEFVEGKRSP